MSEPKRFDCLSDGMWQNSAGDYVLHSDYARLKAEVEQLQKLVGMQKSIDESIDAWIESKRNAAKEGKPSL